MDPEKMTEVYEKMEKWRSMNDRTYVWLARQIGVTWDQLWNTLNGRSIPGKAVASIFMKFYERHKFEIDHA